MTSWLQVSEVGGASKGEMCEWVRVEREWAPSWLYYRVRGWGTHGLMAVFR